MKLTAHCLRPSARAAASTPIVKDVLDGRQDVRYRGITFPALDVVVRIVLLLVSSWLRNDVISCACDKRAHEGPVARRPSEPTATFHLGWAANAELAQLEALAAGSWS